RWRRDACARAIGFRPSLRRPWLEPPISQAPGIERPRWRGPSPSHPRHGGCVAAAYLGSTSGAGLALARRFMGAPRPNRRGRARALLVALGLASTQLACFVSLDGLTGGSPSGDGHTDPPS